MSNELKPCPMCGAAAHLTKGAATENVWPYGEFHRVFCGACQLRQLFYQTSAEAIAAWNRRATPAEQPAKAARPSTLTDEQISAIYRGTFPQGPYLITPDVHRFARAIVDALAPGKEAP